MARFALAAVLFVSGAALAADPVSLAALAGSYKAVSVTHHGKAVPADVLAGFGAKVEKDEITVTVKGKDFPAKLKLDATKTPAHLDLARTARTRVGRSRGSCGWRRASWCWHTPKRPTDPRTSPAGRTWWSCD